MTSWSNNSALFSMKSLSNNKCTIPYDIMDVKNLNVTPRAGGCATLGIMPKTFLYYWDSTLSRKRYWPCGILTLNCVANVEVDPWAMWGFWHPTMIYGDDSDTIVVCVPSVCPSSTTWGVPLTGIVYYMYSNFRQVYLAQRCYRKVSTLSVPQSQSLSRI